jgi:rubrerythrin
MTVRKPYAVDEPTWDAMFEARSEGARHPDPTGHSVERLLDAVEAHARAEEVALGLYQRVAEQSGDPVVALVVQLILDDEHRHHTLLGSMATTLRNAREWRHEPGALPSGDEPRRAIRAELLETTRDLIK